MEGQYESIRSRSGCAGASGCDRADALTLPDSGRSYVQAGVGEDAREIVITAKKYDFDPEVITVKQDERIKLVITALDHDHGFKIDAFHIDQLLKQGEPTTIEFTPDKTGTFPFQCSHFCGLGHKGMKGQLDLSERFQKLGGMTAELSKKIGM